MTGHTRLYRRGAVYYHRAAVPVDIQDTYPRAEETFSLKTRDHREALRLVRIAAVAVDKKFEAHRRQLKRAEVPPVRELSPQDIKKIAEAYYASLLDEDEETRNESFWDGSQTSAPLPSFDEYVELGRLSDERNRMNAARGKIDGEFIDLIDEVLSWDGIDITLSKDSPSRAPLARALQAVSIRAQEVTEKRNKGDIIDTPAMRPLKSGAPLLSSAIEEWVTEKSISSWTHKTKEEKLARLRQFISVNGDKQIDQYSKEDGRRFKSVLMALPPNWTKCGRFEGMSITEAAEEARASGITGMQENTIKKAINSVSAFWNWACVHYDYIERNPLKGQNVRVKTSARDQREPFSDDALATIFKAPVYTGCKSFRYWKEPGDCVLSDKGLFWIPLIGLFSGARMGEIAQLYVSDIKWEEDILSFDINDEGPDKHIKTAGSRRKIPVHSFLLETGLENLVRLRTAQQETRLFPEVEMGKDGHYSSTFSKLFGRFLVSAGVKRPKISFHSFRHNFEDACRNAGISKEIMDALQGHTPGGMAGRYGSGYNLSVLNRAVQSIDYPRVPLAHLKAACKT